MNVRSTHKKKLTSSAGWLASNLRLIIVDLETIPEAREILRMKRVGVQIIGMINDRYSVPAFVYLLLIKFNRIVNFKSRTDG